MKRYVVRVVSTDRHEGELLVEGKCASESFLKVLDAAGVIVRHEVDPRGLTTECFDINAPRDFPDSVTREWAESTAEFMCRGGFNAVCAPETVRGDVETEAESALT
jgi:hypothetical protein